jgi:hypothetical protein
LPKKVDRLRVEGYKKQKWHHNGVFLCVGSLRKTLVYKNLGSNPSHSTNIYNLGGLNL